VRWIVISCGLTALLLLRADSPTGPPARGGRTATSGSISHPLDCPRTPVEAGRELIRMSPIDGPPLTALHTKIADPRWIVARLMKPFELRPAAIMPDYVLPAEEALALARYVYAATPPDDAHVAWRGGDQQTGRELFVRRGCRGCHAIESGEAGLSPRVPNLAGIGSKVRGDWLFNWLKAPRL